MFNLCVVKKVAFYLGMLVMMLSAVIAGLSIIFWAMRWQRQAGDTFGGWGMGFEILGGLYSIGSLIGIVMLGIYLFKKKGYAQKYLRLYLMMMMFCIVVLSLIGIGSMTKDYVGYAYKCGSLVVLFLCLKFLNKRDLKEN